MRSGDLTGGVLEPGPACDLLLHQSHQIRSLLRLGCRSSLDHHDDLPAQTVLADPLVQIAQAPAQDLDRKSVV